MMKKPSKKANLPSSLPLVSVLIPARNEEENIGNCVRSILKQDYPNIEVLVLDDNSSDKTSDVVLQLRQEDRRLQLLRGQPLPQDWAGKCYACHQLSQTARGEWLLFVDADTTHESHMVRATLDIAIKEKISMLSGFPRQDVSGLTQKIVIPVLFYFAIMSWFPLWWLHRTRKRRPTLAIGQFLLFKRGDYLRVGGHVAVKSRIMEDVWFGIEMSRKGFRSLSIDLSKTVTTNMYHNIGAMTEGCMKWFYSVAALSPLALVGFVLTAYIFFLAPFYWVLVGPLGSVFVDDQLNILSIVIIAQIIFVLLMRIICDLYFKCSPISFLFHPLGVAFLSLAAVFGASRRAVGAGVAWKDRVYHSSTHIK
jgi:chlorobactene glucosyltransferase